MHKLISAKPLNLIVLYSIVFEIAWFTSVKFGNTPSCFIALIFISIHFLFARTKHYTFFWSWQRELLWIILFVVLGTCVETLFLHFNILIALNGDKDIGTFFPSIWLLNLWLIFGLSLRPYLTYVRKQPNLFILIAGLFAPISYKLGTKLNGQLVLVEPQWISLLFIGAIWMLCIWIVIFLDQKFFSRKTHAS